MHWSVPETGRGTMIWRSTRNPVHSASRGGIGRSRAPGCPGGAAGSDRSPGPSSFLALCRPPAPAALKTSPVLVTYLNPYTQHGLCTVRWRVQPSSGDTLGDSHGHSWFTCKGIIAMNWWTGASCLKSAVLCFISSILAFMLQRMHRTHEPDY